VDSLVKLVGSNIKEINDSKLQELEELMMLSNLIQW